MATTDTTEASTAEATRSCFEQFRLCNSKLEYPDKTHIENRHADFKLWANSVGAVAHGKASLDWRFHDRPNDICLVKGLLVMLEGFLKDCVAAAGNGDRVKGTLGNIDSTVQNLILIGVAIRRSGRKSRLQKADVSFNDNRDKYLDLRAHLASVIMSKPSEDPRELYSSDHFARVELSPIQDRLVEANLRRRHRFMEAQRHSHLLRGPTLPDRSQGPLLEGILASVKTETTPEAQEGQNSKAVSKTKDPTTTTAGTDTMKTLGTIASAPETGFKGLQQKGPAASTITRITAITAGARYPRAKTSKAEQLSFQCPCCCQALPVQEAENSQFRKHLANDLCPYTCILENCPTPYQLFVAEKQWNEHFMNAHPPRWQCPCCPEDPPTFSSLSEIMIHLQTKHSDTVTDDELADILFESAIHVMGITECPLCDSTGPPDSPELIEHVLEHIHDFSLRSLPWPKDPVLNLNKPVGKFNTTVKGADSVMLWNHGSSPEEECSLQLCSLDLDPPANEEEPSDNSRKDYFAGNDYFLDESSDGRFDSQAAQSSDITNVSSRPSVLPAASHSLPSTTDERPEERERRERREPLAKEWIEKAVAEGRSIENANNIRFILMENMQKQVMPAYDFDCFTDQDLMDIASEFLASQEVSAGSPAGVTTWSRAPSPTDPPDPVYRRRESPLSRSPLVNASDFESDEDGKAKSEADDGDDTDKAAVDSKDDYHGRKPLSWAAANGHEAMVKQLLDTGKADVNSGEADVDSKDDYYGWTPLGLAAQNGHEAVVKLLLATGKVDINSKDSRYGRTPLSWAAQGGHEAVVKLLLATGKVDVDSKDSGYGRTPLSWAAQGGHEAVVKLLLATGKVDVDSKDSGSGQTPLSWAAQGGHEAVVKLLQSIRSS